MIIIFSCRKFRSSILQTGETEGMEIRKHYLKMKPEMAIMEIYDKFKILLLVTEAEDLVLRKAARFKKAIEVNKKCITYFMISHYCLKTHTKIVSML